MKQYWQPGTMIYPLPAVIVTCGDSISNSNMITVAWTGTVCTNPAMCYISVRPERFSHHLILENMEFTINLTTKDMARATDWIGCRSGRDYDKRKETGLTPVEGVKNRCPYIDESPLAIECRVTQVLPLGSHDMMLAQVVNVIADEKYLDPETGSFDLSKAGLLNYSHGNYYEQGKQMGKFGWSVKKKK